MTEQVYSEQVAEASGFEAQYDASTCQSTCIVNCFGGNQDDIHKVRSRLVQMPGGAGDPYNMGVIFREHFGDRYVFEDDASLGQIRDWLKAGEILTTHGWFTGSGHVIILDGVAIDTATLSYKISVKDPWSEFDFQSWTYNNPAVTKYDGYYSSHGLYAAIVAGQSAGHAAEIYRRGELDSKRGGAWIHRVLPEKK